MGKDGKEFPIDFMLVVHKNSHEPFATFIVRKSAGNRVPVTESVVFGIPALDRIIPICSYCRMVRYEEGSWNMLAE